MARQGTIPRRVFFSRPVVPLSCRRPRTVAVIAALILRAGALAAVCAPAVAPAPASADPNAEKVAARAKAAYDRGDFDAAAGLFWQAFQADASRGEWLYSAARASERAGLLDEAAERYEGFLRDPRGGTDKVALARTHLREVHSERAKRLMRRAGESPSPALGYRHARQAADILWDNVDAWLLAAELADRAGLKPEAAECYQTVSRLAPAGSTEHKAALQRLKAIGAVGPPKSAGERRAEAERLKAQDEARKRKAAEDAARKAIEDAARAAEDEAERKAQQFQRELEARDRERQRAEAERQAEERRRNPPPQPAPPPMRLPIPDWAPRAALYGGAALGVVGAALLTVGLVQEHNLDSETHGYLAANGKSKPIPFTYAEARDRAQSAASLQGAGWGLAVTGGVLAAGGALAGYLQQPKAVAAPVQVWPAGSGVIVGWAW